MLFSARIQDDGIILLKDFNLFILLCKNYEIGTSQSGMFVIKYRTQVFDTIQIEKGALL